MCVPVPALARGATVLCSKAAAGGWGESVGMGERPASVGVSVRMREVGSSQGQGVVSDGNVARCS